jgi:TfoX N-terminal domain
MAHDPDAVERVRRCLAGRPDVVEKRMVGGLSFSVGGRMFCGVVGSALMVRVGAEAVALALHEPHVRRMELGGRPLKAFVLVDPEGWADDAALTAWLDRALDVVARGA